MHHFNDLSVIHITVKHVVSQSLRDSLHRDTLPYHHVNLYMIPITAIQYHLILYMIHSTVIHVISQSLRDSPTVTHASC